MSHFSIAALVLIPSIVTLRSSTAIRIHLSNWREMYFLALLMIALLVAASFVGNTFSHRF